MTLSTVYFSFLFALFKIEYAESMEFLVPFSGFRYTEREGKSVISVGKKILN